MSNLLHGLLNARMYCAHSSGSPRCLLIRGMCANHPGRGSHLWSAALPALSCRNLWPLLFPLPCCCLIIGRCAELHLRRNHAQVGFLLSGSYALESGRFSLWRFFPASSPL